MGRCPRQRAGLSLAVERAVDCAMDSLNRRGSLAAVRGAEAANWVLVDMFARVATGQTSAQDSMRQAVRAAQRHLRRS